MPRCDVTSDCSARCSGGSSSSRRARSCSTTRSGSALLARSAARRAASRRGPRCSASSPVSISTSRRSSCAPSRSYFQLANLAEQHHRLRRRREYEHEQRAPRESLAEAVGQLRQRASTTPSSREPQRGSRSSSCSPRTRPRRRGAPSSPPTCAWRRLLAQLDDPSLTPAAARPRRAALAEEITLLWQTDEVRSHAAARRRRGPRTACGSSSELWMRVPESSCAPTTADASRAHRRRCASAPGSAATWTATRATGAETDRARRSSARASWRCDLRDEVRDARPGAGRLDRWSSRRRSCWPPSHVTSRSSGVRERTRAEPRRALSAQAQLRVAAPPERARAGWDRLRAAAELAADLERDRREPARAPGGARGGRPARRPAARVELFGFHLAKLDVRAARRRAPRRVGASCPRRSAPSRAYASEHGAEALDTLIVSGTASAADVLRRARRGRGRGLPSSRSCRSSRRSTTSARRAGIVEELLDEPSSPARGARGPARGDGRVLRLGQGRRLPRRPVGDPRRAASARRARERRAASS